MDSFNCYNIILEAIGACSRYYQGEDFLKLNDSLKKRVGYKKEIGLVLEQLQTIYLEVMNDIALDEKYKEYFLNYDEFGIDNFASLIFQEVLFEEYVQLDTCKAIVKKNPVIIFEEYMNRDDNRMEFSMEEIIELLHDSGLSDVLKWKFIEIYANFDQIVDELFGLLTPVIKRIQVVYQKYQKVLYTMHQYWSEEGNLLNKIKNVFNINISIDCKAYVYANYMMCNSLRIMDSRYHKGINMFYIGALFQQGNFLQVDELSRDEMYACLKVLCDPSKYEMLTMLKEEAKYGSQLAKALNLSAATISHHVNALLILGIIDIQKDANRLYYRLNKDKILNIIMTLQKDFVE